jgi:hypothetical protein
VLSVQLVVELPICDRSCHPVKVSTTKRDISNNRQLDSHHCMEVPVVVGSICRACGMTLGNNDLHNWAYITPAS